MKAALLKAYGADLDIVNVPFPEAREGYEIVKVSSCGLCRTDLHIMRGSYPNIKLPLILGHEIAGISETAGNVIIYGSKGCGRCYYCLRTEYQLCEHSSDLGITANGGFAEFVSVPVSNLIPLNGLKLEYVSVLADAGITAFRAIRKLEWVLSDGDDILIIGGTGGVGTFAIQFAKAMYNVNVTVVGRNRSRFERAYKFGADIVSDYSGEFKKYKGVIDIVGTAKTMEFGYAHLLKTGLLVVVGEEGGKIEIDYDDIHHGEQAICSSLWGSLEDLKEVIKIASSSGIKWDVQKYSLDSINEAIHALALGELDSRAVIVP